MASGQERLAGNQNWFRRANERDGVIMEKERYAVAEKPSVPPTAL